MRDVNEEDEGEQGVIEEEYCIGAYDDTAEEQNITIDDPMLLSKRNLFKKYTAYTVSFCLYINIVTGVNCKEGKLQSC